MKLIKKMLVVSGLICTSLVNFAFAGGVGTDTTMGNLANFSNVIDSNAGTLFNIVIIVATLAGLILIIKGLVHLKQNYTGSGQEKHMSKGIASLGFGTALILAIPLSHMLVSSINPSSTFNTGVTAVDFSTLSAAT
jgi:hypothetical protein